MEKSNGLDLLSFQQLSAPVDELFALHRMDPPCFCHPSTVDNMQNINQAKYHLVALPAKSTNHMDRNIKQFKFLLPKLLGDFHQLFRNIELASQSFYPKFLKFWNYFSKFYTKKSIEPSKNHLFLSNFS